MPGGGTSDRSGFCLKRARTNTPAAALSGMSPSSVAARHAAYAKNDFAVDKIRRFPEPGPIALVSSALKRQTSIMTMAWHMVMDFEPSLIGCYIWSENHSFEMVRRSKT